MLQTFGSEPEVETITKNIETFKKTEEKLDRMEEKLEILRIFN